MNTMRNIHIRRYGFHGTSHRYVKHALWPDRRQGRRHPKLSPAILSVALPSPPSRTGKCMDTSMGLLPSGWHHHGHPLCGRARSFCADLHCRKENISPSEMTICSIKEIRLLGYFWTLLRRHETLVNAASHEGNHQAKLACDICPLSD